MGSAVLTKLIGFAAELGISLGALIGIAAAVVAAIAAIGAAIYLNSDYKKLKDLNEEIEKHKMLYQMLEKLIKDWFLILMIMTQLLKD